MELFGAAELCLDIWKDLLLPQSSYKWEEHQPRIQPETSQTKNKSFTWQQKTTVTRLQTPRHPSVQTLYKSGASLGNSCVAVCVHFCTFCMCMCLHIQQSKSLTIYFRIFKQLYEELATMHLQLERERNIFTHTFGFQQIYYTFVSVLPRANITLTQHSF